MQRWWRPAAGVLLVLAAVGVAVAVGVPPVAQIRAWVGAAGWAGPMLYAALYAALTLTPAPASVLSIAAGALFGLGVGVPVVLAGAITGAVAGFAVARYLGRATVADLQRRRGGDRLARLDALLTRRGLLTMIGIRIAPVVPFALLNMACGLTAVRLRDYTLGSAIGMAPGATAFVAIGAFGADPGSTAFLVSVTGVVLLLVAGAVLARRHRTQPAC